MSTKISNAVKEAVILRARNRCEYCKIRQEDSFLKLQIDHIISLKHGGGSELSNLALACPHCNQSKGSDIATFLGDYQNIIALYNPRIDIGEEHFTIADGEILGLTTIGLATVKLLQFNTPERLAIRKILFDIGQYP